MANLQEAIAGWLEVANDRYIIQSSDQMVKIAKTI